MMKTRTRWLVLIVVVAFSGCVHPTAKPEFDAEAARKDPLVQAMRPPVAYASWTTRQFRQTDPKAEVEKNFAKLNYRVFHAMGMGMYFPGIDFHDGLAVQFAYGSMRSDTGTDVIESEAQEVHMDAAREFASIYNRELLIRLRSSGALLEKVRAQSAAVRADMGGRREPFFWEP